MQPRVLGEAARLVTGVSAPSERTGPPPALEPLGLLAGDSPYIDPDPELAEILRSAAAIGPTAVIDGSTKLLAARGQWLETRENFNFNQHFFELGTIDTPDWKIADSERARLLRARESLTAIWGNPDGSLDIDIGHDTPPADEQANWLPAPTGAFMLALRIYRPRPEAFGQAAWPMPTVNAAAGWRGLARDQPRGEPLAWRSPTRDFSLVAVRAASLGLLLAS